MTEAVIIFFLLCLNGLFAMCEIALVSSRKSRLEQRAKAGSKGASIALGLLKEPERFLSTVQIGITLVGIIAGAYGGESFGKYLQPEIERYETFKPYAEQIAFTLIVIVITYFSLIIGELVPKTIALNNPEQITIKCAPFMRGLAFVTYPLVIFLSASTKILLKVLFIKEKTDPPVTEEELKYMIDTGSQHGIIEKGEGTMIHGILRFGDKRAKDIMTEKSNITWLDMNYSYHRLFEEIFQSAYSKYPVCDGSLDKVQGILPLTEVLKFVKRNDFNVKDHLQEALFFPESALALNVMEEFRAKKIHMGFVVNEHGSVVGLITLQDLLENIAGEFPDFDENDEPAIILRPDGSFLMNGDTSMEELQLALNFENFSLNSSYKTLAGFIIYQLQTAPKAGSYFIFGKYKFEVIDMDGNRIDKVLISLVKV